MPAKSAGLACAGGGGLERAKERPPDRMALLGGGELELRVDGERLAEFAPAFLLAALGAQDEGEVLVRSHPLGLRRVERERALEIDFRAVVIAVLVHPYAHGERALRGAEDGHGGHLGLGRRRTLS